MFPKRIDDHTTRHPQNPLKTNSQRQLQSRIHFSAVLYSRRVIHVFHSRSAPRPTARRFTELQNFFAPHDGRTALGFDLR